MKIHKIAAIFGLLLTVSAHADGVLTGDTRLACEAILCLSSGTQPSECNPSLNRYYGISKKKWKDTVKARKNFLNLCPTANADGNMTSLVDALANAAGKCDVGGLNKNVVFRNGDARISNQLPQHCRALYNHPNTAYANSPSEHIPVYVGQPETGGFWTSPDNYQSALTQYNNNLWKYQQRSSD